MTDYEVKKMIIPIETHLASLFRVLSAREKRSNPRLMKKAARLRFKAAQLKAFANRLVRSHSELEIAASLVEVENGNSSN